MPMQEINWGNFKAKFNRKEQSSFERLCYLLFCSEFNKDIGISRYKNHAGIETDPIEVNGEYIGWQAKFYDTRLSEHKKDFIRSIDTATTRHPKINKIIFYTNQDFSQGRKKNDPKYKVEVETHAKSKSVKIEWRTNSFFESPFVCEENASIVQHFFVIDKSIIDFICELIQHTESILKPIHSKIIFSGNEIKIDRSKVIEGLKKTLNNSSLVILSGVAGVGKTAVIKDFYDLIKETIPFFVFKAIEFNLPNINQLFRDYGNFTLLDLTKEYQKINDKYIIIDSAEKLSDIEHQDVFQEFLSTLLDNSWKIIFTTRYSYLDDLKYQFVEVYKLSFQPINIEILTKEDLINFSEQYKFNLPGSERLLELLRNPFYLNEYLKNYRNLNNTTSYTDFKNILWNKQILKSSFRLNNTHIKRENCFLKIVQKKANDGHFFVKADECESEILQKLDSDEIIKYDSNAGGYFITHDIYEEWALDKIVERAFNDSDDYNLFFENIGSSLPIRRAFRNWLSEKLFVNKVNVKRFIEDTISGYKIADCWKDEILVSVLLSDYSQIFFQIFEEELLENNQEYLVRIVFLLRIACKEIDEDFLMRLGISKEAGFPLESLFTKPKGCGWDCVINFINKHKDRLGLKYLNKFLPLLDDWNNKNKQGETTKKASRIALYYYNEITEKVGFGYGSRDEIKNKLIRTILNGSYEIKDELKSIFEEVVSKRETDHRSKYYELIQAILSSAIDSFEIAKNLPEQVILLADLFWFQIHDQAYWLSGARMGVEQYFCLPEHHRDYFPSSAFQTPIFQLLRFAPKQTIDFILSFTNKTVGCYTKSILKNEAEEVEIYIDETKTIKQHISNRLWNMYRGGGQGSPYLLESIHMALEKWLLENAISADRKIIESCCKYLIENSKSASITAIVTSAVLSQPSKLFDIAKILFKTKEFFLYDTRRMKIDQKAESYYSIGYGLNYQHQIFQDERIKTCDDKHRKWSLEQLVVYYQFFRSEEVSEQETKERQKIIWKILDKYYEQLPEKSKESESDKTWKLYLASMDRRKMHPTTEEKDGQIILNFNPEIDPELKKSSEESIKDWSDARQYASLELWAYNKFDKSKEYGEYEQYENNPKLVLKETKEIVDGLKSSTNSQFHLFNSSIPAFTCSALIRDYEKELPMEDKTYCKNIIVEYAKKPFRPNYRYQISDGVEAAINALPFLFDLFPGEKEDFKIILLFVMFDSYPIGQYKRICDYSIEAIINNLWDISYEDAHAIFLGFLKLKPKFNQLFEKERHKNFNHRTSRSQVLERFVEESKPELENFASNNVLYDEIKLNELNLEILETAFQLLPSNTSDAIHIDFINNTLPLFRKELLVDNDRVDYSLRHRFFEKFSYFILNREPENINKFIEPFVDNFTISREMSYFFQEFITVEDRINKYEEFWTVWYLFYNKIVEMCKEKSSNSYTKEIVCNYLLAWPYWREDAKEWHTLKEREKLFFKKVVDDIGDHPSVLYSVSKILNDIGSKFIDDGIIWLSNALQKNTKYFSEKLETGTVYYIENIVRKFILTNRQKIKTKLQFKNQIITILNFLVECGSVTGYLLRENIL